MGTYTAVVLDPTDLAQMGSEGAPVPANTFVSLVHVNTQIPLHTSTSVIPASKYGGECEMSCFVDMSPTKGVLGKRNGKMLNVGNHFAMTTAEAVTE